MGQMWPMVGILEMLASPALVYYRGKYSNAQGDWKFKVDLSLKPTHPPWKGPEDTFFTMSRRNIFVKEVWTSLKSSVTTLLCRNHVTVRTLVIQLGKLNVKGVLTSWGSMIRLVTLNHQSGHCDFNGQQSQSSNQNSLILASHMCAPVNHGAPGIEAYWKPTKFLLDL